MVSVAKSGGYGESLFPEGTTALTIPHDLHTALEQAYRILSWQENLPEEEMPAKWQWHIDWELDTHFAEVARKREAKYGPTGDSDQQPEDLWEDNSHSARFKD